MFLDNWKYHGKYLISVITVAVVFLSQLNLSFATGEIFEKRNFTTEINPGCSTDNLYPANCSRYTNMSLIHIRSDGREDSFHFLWSFIGAPTLLMVRAPLNSKLSVDWVNMLVSSVNSSITFTPEPYYSFGWSLVKVWMFNDTDDKVKLDKVDQRFVDGYETKNFIWERLVNQTTVNETDVRMTFVSSVYDHKGDIGKASLGPNGFFKFTIRMKSMPDYSDILPYMLYSENGTQVDIAFNDVQLNTTVDQYSENTRIGFKFILIQDEYLKNSSERMRLERVKSLDDEHTPGVFETFSVRTPLLHKRDQSYIQWKPICYTGEVRDVVDSVDVWAYELKNASSVDGEDNIQDSILYSYYGSQVDDMLLEAMNVSFGTQQDGFYKKTKHISWTYSTGFGEPPMDFVSKLVLLVVAIGLGIPAIIIILSLIYMLVKRIQRRPDDLLLGR